MKLFFLIITANLLLFSAENINGYRYRKYTTQVKVHLIPGLPKSFEPNEDSELIMIADGGADSLNGKTYFFIRTKNGAKLWVNEHWISITSSTLPSKIIRRKGYLTEVQLSSNMIAHKAWTRRDDLGEPTDPKPLMISNSRAVFESKDPIFISFRKDFPESSHFSSGNKYNLKWVAYRAYQNGMIFQSVPATDGNRYSLVHEKKTTIIGAKNNLDELELVSAASLTDKSYSNIENGFETFLANEPAAFETVWAKTQFTFGIPVDTNDANEVGETYQLVPFESGRDGGGCSTQANQDIIIRSSEDFENLRLQLASCNNDTKILEKYKFNPDKYSILSRHTSSMCDVRPKIILKRHDDTKQADFSLTQPKESCFSGAPSGSLNLIETKRIPSDYKVSIKSMYILRDGTIKVDTDDLKNAKKNIK